MAQLLFAQKYLVTRSLGAGGMGEVFLARQIGLIDFERPVVIKRPFLSDDDRDQTQVFLDEARVAALLEHPNIVTIYDVLEHEGAPYIVMEYLPGTDLAKLARRSRARSEKIPIEHILTIIRDVANGLSHAHARKDSRGDSLGIVHRDISPHNIVLTHDGRAVIVDFGIAKARTKKSHTARGLIKGKTAYMSPEQTRGEVLDGRSDLFSLGIIFYEMLSGRYLFRRSNDVKTLDAVREAPIPRLAIDDELRQILAKLLARSREDRFATAGTLANSIEDYAHQKHLRLSGRKLGQYIQHTHPALKDRAHKSDHDTDTLDVPQTAPLPPQKLPPPQEAFKESTRAPLVNMNLGPKPTLLFGRAKEMQEGVKALESHPILVLEGGEGMGKSHLAHHLAHRLRDEFLDEGGIWWVDLSLASEASTVVGEVAAAVGFRIDSHATLSASIRQSGESLGARGKILVVLDGCDGGSAPEMLLPFWRQSAPQARFLLTRQNSLAIDAAHHIRVGPLSDDDAFTMLRSKLPNTSTDEQLHNIVKSLAGIPLALELALARLLEDHEGVFAAKLLESENPTGLIETQAHRLTQAFKASFSSLQRDEQQALAMLSTFHSGFTLASAAQVLQSEPPQTLMMLDRLVHLGFLRIRAGHSETRFFVSRVAYGFTHSLAFDRERAQVLVDEAVIKVVEDHTRLLSGPLGVSSRRVLRAERENLIDIVERGLNPKSENPPHALRALAGLKSAFLGGERSRFLGLLNRGIHGCSEEALQGRAGLFVFEARGDLLREAGREQDAEADYLKALSIAKTLPEDRWCEALLWRNLGALRAGIREEELLRQSPKDDARGLDEFERAHRLFKREGDRHFEARVFVSLAQTLVRRGVYERAQLLFEDARKTFRSVGDLRFEAAAVRGLGIVQAWTENYEDAVKTLGIAQRTSALLGDDRGRGMAWWILAQVHELAEEAEASERSFLKAREGFARSGYSRLRARLCENARHHVKDPRPFEKEAAELWAALGESPQQM